MHACAGRCVDVVKEGGAWPAVVDIWWQVGERPLPLIVTMTISLPFGKGQGYTEPLTSHESNALDLPLRVRMHTHAHYARAREGGHQGRPFLAQSLVQTHVVVYAR